MFGGSHQMAASAVEPSLADAALNGLRGDGESSAVKAKKIDSVEAGAKRSVGGDDEWGASAKRIKGAQRQCKQNANQDASPAHPVMIHSQNT